MDKSGYNGRVENGGHSLWIKRVEGMTMKYKNYLQIDQEVDRLFADKRYDEGIALLEKARTLFPERLAEILIYESINYLFKEDRQGCLDVIEESLQKGFFLNLEWDVYDPMREDPHFKSMFETNRELRAAAWMQARMTYEVLLPGGYSREKKYPLFITLHGNMSTMLSFKERWEPATMLEQGFVVLYIQSSQVNCTNGFNWNNSWQKAREEIKAAYDAVLKQYPIDPARVVVAGFSAGGMAAVEVTLANLFPVKGFITLCSASKTESFSLQAAKSANARGVKGVMLRGELDQAAQEGEIAQVFKEAGLPCWWITNEGVGHVFPDDFPEKLVDAIKYIMS
jgi:predicted esterase